MLHPPARESMTNQVLAPVMLTLPRLSRMRWRETEHQRLPTSRSAAARAAALRLSGPKGPLKRSPPIKSCSTRAHGEWSSRASVSRNYSRPRAASATDRPVGLILAYSRSQVKIRADAHARRTDRQARRTRTKDCADRSRHAELVESSSSVERMTCSTGRPAARSADSGRGRMTPRNVARS